MAGSGRSQLSTAAGVLVLAVVLAAPVALGTVHVATRALVGAAGVAALLLVIVDRARQRRALAIPAPALALLVVVAATALQLVPLPQWLLAALSPATDDLLASSLGDYGAHALSLDPQGTAIELGKLAGYLAFFVAAVAILGRSERRRRMIFAVAALASVEALLALVEQATGTHKVLFFYTPHDDWQGAFRGTFVNPNHFGALMCLGAPCALSIGLTERRWRVPAFVALILINVAAILSYSRAALLIVPLSQIGTLALDRYFLGSGRGRPASTRWLFAAGIAAALGVTLVIGMDAILYRIVHAAELAGPFAQPYSKLHQWPNALRLIGEFPLTGVGRGAFEPAFTRFADLAGSLRFSHVENQYLQAAADWGLPVVAAIAILVWRALAAAWRELADEPVGVPAFAGVAALALHDVVDFSTELPGIALPALGLLATLCARRGARVRARTWHVVVPALAGAALAAGALARPLAAAGERIAAEARNPATPLAAVVADGERLRREHPADYYIQTVVAERLARAGRPEAMRWLNGAIYLNPWHAAPHVLAAELLLRAGHRSQALLEYKLAVGVAPEPARIWERFTSLDDLRAVTPAEPRLLLGLGDWLVGANRAADAETVYGDALERAPGDVELERRLVQAALARGDRPAAAARARSLLRADHGRESRLLAARALVAAGALDEAARVLDDGLDRDPDVFALELELAAAYARAGSADVARARLDQLTWGRDVELLARMHEIRADIEGRAGNPHQQQWELEQAARLRER
jgi:hypothetical protein